MKKSDPRNAVVAMLVSEARQRSGRTKSDVTREINRYGVGWDSTILGRIEKQQRVLQLAEAAVLADVLGVDLYDLVQVRDPDDRPVTVIHEGQFMPTITLDESRGFQAVRVHDDDLYPPELVEAISGEKYKPVCCSGECCGPGSYCCANAGPHEHGEA